jgi:DNA (cytosine-5)-methyltransferase 1
LGDVNFTFPTPPKTEVKLGDILEKKVDAKYTISDTLWAGHQRRKAEHIEKGNGFGYSLFNEKSKYTSTISARNYKDGSEILIEQKGKNPRKLTPREAARLQGFPDDFVLPASDTQTYKQFGNSVAVPVVNALAKEVLKTMKKINLKKVEHKEINVEKIRKEKVSAALKALKT